MKPALADIPRPWLKFYDPGIPPHLEYPTEPLQKIFEASCQQHAERIAVQFLGKKLRYAQIEKSACALAAWLKEQGINSGDRVMLMLPNSPQFVIAYYAALKRGAIIVPISPLDTAVEVTYKFNNCGAKLIIFLDLLFEKVATLLQDNPKLVALVADVSEYLPFPKNFLFKVKKRRLGKPLPNYKRPNLFRFAKILDKYHHAKVDTVVNNLADPALIIYTGGTTGVSKGVVLSHRAMTVNMTQAKVWAHVTKEDVALCVLPFFHGFGVSVGLNLGLASGGKMVLLPRWDASQALRHFEEDGITLFAGVPTMYNDMLHHKNFAKLKKAKLRGCFVGAAPVPESLKKAFHEKTGGILIEGYGLTEAVTAKCANPLYGCKKEKSIGIPWPDTVMVIVGDKGELLPPGSEGEIILHSPDLMTGYWQNEKATQEAIRDGWLYTGDIGRMDEDGYFYIVDRKKDLIISGGYNVYPAEVEEVLYSHPAILEACVVGVADEKLGEVAKAFVVVKPGMSVTEEELTSFLKERLIRYKVPRYFEFRDSLPKSPVGKILRKELRPKN